MTTNTQKIQELVRKIDKQNQNALHYAIMLIDEIKIINTEQNLGIDFEDDCPISHHARGLLETLNRRR